MKSLRYYSKSLKDKFENYNKNLEDYNDQKKNRGLWLYGIL